LPESIQKFSKGKKVSLGEESGFYEKHYEKLLDVIKNSGIKFDVIHDNQINNSLITSEVFKNAGNFLEIPIVTTIRDGVKDKYLPLYHRIAELQEEGRDVRIVALSNSHKENLEQRGMRVDRVIHNGIPVFSYDWQAEKKDYLFWIGQISEHKGTDLAVQIAKHSGRPLILAGRPFSEQDVALYNEKVKPLLTHEITGPDAVQQTQEYVEALDDGTLKLSKGDIHYINLVNDMQKNILFKHAYAMLMPNRWDEPFGLVVPESYSCGTPVIGTNTGSLKEIITPEVGIKVPLNSDHQVVEDMVSSMGALGRIDSATCRKFAEEKFSDGFLAENYITYFKEILNGGKS